MEIPHRELATANAALLVVGNLLNKLKCTTAPSKQLPEAILLLFGMRSDIQVIRRVGASPLRRILWRLSNSKLSKSEYNKVSQLWQEGLANKASFPVLWGDWRPLIERFNLGDALKLDEWFLIVDTLIKIGWKDPSALAKVDMATFKALTSPHEPRQAVFQLWKSASLLYAGASAGAILALNGISDDAEALLLRLKAVSLADSAIRKDLNDSMSKMRLPEGSPPPWPDI